MRSKCLSISTKAQLLTIALWLWVGSATVAAIKWRLLDPVVTIHVKNDMKPSSATLSFDCKSGDDDLGFKQPGVGQEYKWEFTKNIWLRTVFYCDFWWNYKKIEGATVYEGWIETAYDPIYYKANEQGIYKSYDQSNWDFKYSWGQ